VPDGRQLSRPVRAAPVLRLLRPSTRSDDQPGGLDRAVPDPRPATWRIMGKASQRQGPMWPIALPPYQNFHVLGQNEIPTEMGVKAGQQLA
jgi:hypothetical protein